MNHRDVEQLSSYLDGQLSPSVSARLETRLASDLALVSALDALRASRALLRRMPKRRAPRNFLLTPKMVGLKPPLPRSYPVFKFATAFAAFLFFISFVTTKTAQLAASAPAPSAYGGMGGGGADDSVTEAPMMESALAATEPPLATEPPVAPEATMESALVVSTPTPDSADRVWAEGPGFPKAGGETVPASPRPLLTPWQAGFGILALFGAASMFLIQKLAARKWRVKN